MTTIVTSDVHIGSEFFLRDAFLRFLDGLPAGADLVLNGDTVDRYHRSLRPDDRAIVDRLREESYRRRVFWVCGNHDDGFRLEDPGEIHFVADHRIGRRLYVAHGDHFANVRPYHRLFILSFRFMHRARIRLGAEAVHVAHYAKKFPRLYEMLRRHVMLNAVEYARENGYAAVACGHVHAPEDTLVNGIRYLNTGAWTERPVYYLNVTDESLCLCPVHETAPPPAPAPLHGR